MSSLPKSPTRSGTECVTRSPEEELKQEGVVEKIYANWLKKELDDESACIELPFTILILLGFTILGTMRLRQHEVFAVEQAIAQDILENANFAWENAVGTRGSST